MTDELRHILDEPQDITFLPPERTAAAPQTLWRGVRAPRGQLPFPDSWVRSENDFAEHKGEIGLALLDMLERSGWEADSGVGLGRHWSTSRPVAENFAGIVAPYALPVLIRVEWDGTGEDADRTNVGGDWPDEFEVTLLPGTKVRVTGVFVLRERWKKVFDGEQMKTAAEPGGVLPYPASDYGYAWKEVDLDTYETITQDNLTTFTIVLSPSRQVIWTAEDAEGVIERGNFMWSTGDLKNVFEQGDRLVAQFDTRPVMQAKDFAYRDDYEEKLPTHFPEPDFREPWQPPPDWV